MALSGIRKKQYTVVICYVVKAAVFVSGLRGGPTHMLQIPHACAYILSPPPLLFQARAQIYNDVFVFYI